MINLKIVKNRKIWLSLSSLLVASSIVCIFLWGFNFGIDFTGGSLMEIKFSKGSSSAAEIQDELSDLSLGSLSVQPTEDNTFILKFKETDKDSHDLVLGALNQYALSLAGPDFALEGESGDKPLEEIRFDSVGPSIGKELKSKSFNTIIIVLILIILYVAFAFRKISKPVSSWSYGLASIIVLLHDVIIVLGVFAFLGKFYGTEINTPFIAAILTVLGYSVNDTIVIFDRIRENLPKSDDSFGGTINKSINQTLGRSINTSFTTLLVLLSILFFGGKTLVDFVLALSIGVFVGTYSSIFLASPLLILFDKRRRK